MNNVVRFDHMRVGAKGGGKHWTAEEVAKRGAAAKKFERAKPIKLKMPDWIDDEAKKVWKRTIKSMEGFDILDKVDEDSLATYCDAVARHKETALMIKEKGYVVYNSVGTEQTAPWVTANQSYARLMMQYADKLGLNANARARLAKKMADEGDDKNGELFD